MIEPDQPTCFPDDVVVRVSSRSDGTVLDKAIGVHDGSIVSNRTKFCQAAGIDYGDVVYQRIIYDDKRTYALIAEVDNGSTTKFTSEVVADAIYTDQLGVGLFLPVADCAATVFYEPTLQLLALAHLGRHSTVAGLMQKLIKTIEHKGGSAEQLTIWMSPSVKQPNYRMEYFTEYATAAWKPFCKKRDGGYYLDLQGYNKARAVELGVPVDNIIISSVNTATDPNYFSHSQGETSGRFGVVAYRK